MEDSNRSFFCSLFDNFVLDSFLSLENHEETKNVVLPLLYFLDLFSLGTIPSILLRRLEILNLKENFRMEISLFMASVTPYTGYATT